MLVSGLLILARHVSVAVAEDSCEGGCLVRLLIGLEHEMPEARELARDGLRQRWTDERVALADFARWMQPSQPAALDQLLKEPAMQRAILEVLLGRLEQPKWKIELIKALAEWDVYYPSLSFSVAAPPLRRLLRDPDASVRASAVRALGELAERARDYYGTDADYMAAAGEVTVMLRDPDPSIRAAALAAAGGLRAVGQIAAVIERLEDDAPGVRTEAIRTLVRLDGGRLSPEHCRQAARAVEDPDWRVREAAIRGLGQAGATVFAESIASRLDDERPEVRVQALEALARFQAGQFARPVHALLRDHDARVRSAAAAALAALNEPVASGSIAELLRDRDPSVRRAALLALGRLDGSAYAEAIAQRLTDDETQIRCLAVWAIWKLNAREQASALKRQLRNPDRCRAYPARQPDEEIDLGVGDWATVQSSATFVLRTWGLTGDMSLREIPERKSLVP